VLLNTFLDADVDVDWRGTWADRLIDEEINSESTETNTATGLMVFGKLEDSYMHMAPFSGRFNWTPTSLFPAYYELGFAAGGPWGRAGAPIVAPFTHDKKVRQELLHRSTQNEWGTVYRRPATDLAI
jgi:hypothetical protein